MNKSSPCMVPFCTVLSYTSTDARTLGDQKSVPSIIKSTLTIGDNPLSHVPSGRQFSRIPGTQTHHNARDLAFYVSSSNRQCVQKFLIFETYTIKEFSIYLRNLVNYFLVYTKGLKAPTRFGSGMFIEEFKSEYIMLIDRLLNQSLIDSVNELGTFVLDIYGDFRNPTFVFHTLTSAEDVILKKKQGSEVTIYCDSQAALKALQSARRLDCRVSRTLWPKLNPKATRMLLGLDRKSARILVGVITGHCSIEAFGGNGVGNSQDFCRLCEDEEELETVEHILCHCPRLQSLRLKWLGKSFHDELGDVAGCNLGDIMGFIRGTFWIFKDCSAICGHAIRSELCIQQDSVPYAYIQTINSFLLKRKFELIATVRDELKTSTKSQELPCNAPQFDLSLTKEIEEIRNIINTSILHSHLFLSKRTTGLYDVYMNVTLLFFSVHRLWMSFMYIYLKKWGPHTLEGASSINERRKIAKNKQPRKEMYKCFESVTLLKYQDNKFEKNRVDWCRIEYSRLDIRTENCIKNTYQQSSMITDRTSEQIRRDIMSLGRCLVTRCSMLNCLPVDLLAKQLAMSTAVKLSITNRWISGSRGHAEIVSDYCIPEPLRETSGVDGLNVYTDGSKTTIGVVEEFGKKISFRLNDECTILQEEISAIKKDIRIYTDSQAAIKSLTGVYSASKLVQECRESLNEMARHSRITLISVKEHGDIMGNNIADILAKAGKRMAILDIDQFCGVPLAAIGKQKYNICFSLAQDRWSQEHTCLIAKLSRTHLSTLLSVLTGHSKFGNHARRIGLPYNVFCRRCQNEEETTLQKDQFWTQVHLGLYRPCCACLNQCLGWESIPPPPTSTWPDKCFLSLTDNAFKMKLLVNDSETQYSMSIISLNGGLSELESNGTDRKSHAVNTGLNFPSNVHHSERKFRKTFISAAARFLPGRISVVRPHFPAEAARLDHLKNCNLSSGVSKLWSTVRFPSNPTKKYGRVAIKFADVQISDPEGCSRAFCRQFIEHPDRDKAKRSLVRKHNNLLVTDIPQPFTPAKVADVINNAKPSEPIDPDWLAGIVKTLEAPHLSQLSNHLTISQGLNQQKPCERTVLVALDLSKAFDTVIHATLFENSTIHNAQQHEEMDRRDPKVVHSTSYYLDEGSKPKPWHRSRWSLNSDRPEMLRVTFDSLFTSSAHATAITHREAINSAVAEYRINVVLGGRPPPLADTEKTCRGWSNRLNAYWLRIDRAIPTNFLHVITNPTSLCLMDLWTHPVEVGLVIHEEPLN
ncbi:hypothetical protein CVS40_9192 [Lucilia cuprina]|nr:hypothetical protein CVS40_9192 [Lucilia cuprina]